MKLLANTAFLVILPLAILSSVRANTITFDEFPAANTNAALTTDYAGLGVTFDNRNSGTWGGTAQGDPGNWSLQGTNGAQFLGNNGVNNGNTYTESIFFATPQPVVSFDASRANGSSAGQTLTANAYSGEILLSSETFTLGNINTWVTFILTGADISRVDVVGSSNGFSPYAIDNLQFSTTVPEPGSLGLFGFGLLITGFLRRRLSH